VARAACHVPTKHREPQQGAGFLLRPDFLLRRHDYHVEASGGFAAAQYVFDSVTVQGITLPTKWRAYMRDEHLLPVHDRLMVSIDLSDILYS
jgi:hypothetical protein